MTPASGWDEAVFRGLVIAVLLGALGTSAWFRWKARRVAGAIARTREPWPLIAGRLLVALPLFGGVLAYLARPDWMAWASLAAPSAVRWTGVALGLLTLSAVYWVLASLGSNVSETVLTREQHQLVMTGPYRWVRHPLYGTGIALFVSIGLMAANWFILLWAMIALAAVRLVVVPHEEAHLLRRFPDEYRRYRDRTGALVPSWRGARRRA